MITAKDIGIVTPFKQQQMEIINRLAEIRLENITVGTVETFQGQERTIIILSTVRSKIFKHENNEHIGFLSNPKVCESISQYACTYQLFYIIYYIHNIIQVLYTFLYK